VRICGTEKKSKLPKRGYKKKKKEKCYYSGKEAKLGNSNPEGGEKKTSEGRKGKNPKMSRKPQTEIFTFERGRGEEKGYVF